MTHLKRGLYKCLVEKNSKSTLYSTSQLTATSKDFTPQENFNLAGNKKKTGKFDMGVDSKTIDYKTQCQKQYTTMPAAQIPNGNAYDENQICHETNHNLNNS